MLKHQAITDKFQRLCVSSHESEEDTKAMTIWEKCKGSRTVINCWPESGTWPFTMGIRRAILFCQILQENFLFFLSYSFPSTCYRQIHTDFNLRFYSLKTRWLGWDMRLVFFVFVIFHTCQSCKPKAKLIKVNGECILFIKLSLSIDFFPLIQIVQT